MDAYAFAAAVLALALLIGVIVGSLAWAHSLGAASRDGELLVAQDLAADTAVERDEWKRRTEQAEKDAEDAATRGQRAVAKARERGADLADPDDDAAFQRVLSRAKPASGGPAAGALAAASVPPLVPPVT